MMRQPERAASKRHDQNESLQSLTRRDISAKDVQSGFGDGALARNLAEALHHAKILMRKRIRLCVIVCLLMPTLSARAQEGPARSNQPPVFHISTQFVVFDALVHIKKTDSMVGNLEAKDFLLSEDHAPQSITYFSHEQLPLSIVFLFDLTRSVRPILRPLAKGANEILRHLRPQDEISVMTFSSHTELIQDFTTDRDLVSAAIKRVADMKSDEGTFIHEDMYEAVDQALKSRTTQCRHVLVWLTDGTSNVENSVTKKVIGHEAPPHLHTKREAMDKLLNSSVVVSALIDRSVLTDSLVAASHMTPLFFLSGSRIGDIRNYADVTGGPVVNTSKSEAAVRLELLLDQIRGAYTIGYKPTTASHDQTFHAIHLQFAPSVLQAHPELRGRTLVLRTKQGYYR
ncbi:MAG TPA: VWA domain-containing protein [Candidatus Dormibacteraeota bacterium]|jgi:VWFA-related protein|nr:VWA domain-containing protein [Candidatus Dormibacteraeota bacterium]